MKMNKKPVVNKVLQDTEKQKRVSKVAMENQQQQQMKNIQDCLKSLDNGELTLRDIESFKQELILKPFLGDHLQYKLHKYCQQDVDKTNADMVVKLAELCYSQRSVTQFGNISRFVGCVYYISHYLIKKGKHKAALNIVSSLYYKQNEIIKCTETDIRDFLCNIHSNFMGSAIVLTNSVKSVSDEIYQTSITLALESLKVLELITTAQMELGKKVVKTSVLFFQAIQHYKESDVLVFYEKLFGVFEVIFPKLNTADYFMYFIYKLNQIKKTDSKTEVYRGLKKCVDLLTLCLDSPTVIKNILNKTLDFFWNEIQPEKWINNKEFSLLNTKHPYSVLYFLVVSNIFSFGTQFMWINYEKNWSEKVTVKFVQKMSETVIAFHKSHFLSSALYCSPAKAPMDFCFGELLTGNLKKLQYTVRLCFKNKVPESLSLVPITREAYKLSLECLEHMKALDCCKDRRSYYWKYSVVHHRNTVEDICRHPQTEETHLMLKDCSQEILKEIVNSSETPPFDLKSIKILFHRWHAAILKLKNYQDALYACVVYHAFYPEQEKDIITMWLQAKSESSNEIFEELTMPEIYKMSDKSLREFSKNYDSSNFCLKSVLLLELKAYGSCPVETFQNSNTYYKLATRIWKQLEKCKLDMWEMSTALFSVIAANINGDNEKLPKSFHEKVEKHITQLMNWRYKGKAQCRSLLHAANLTFCLFLYSVKMAEKSEGKMDTTYMVLDYLKKAAEEKVKFGEDVDLNLTCDIIPSSNHLTVELETNYLNELNKIMDLWNDSLRNDLGDSPSSSEFELWLRNVKHVAYFYELIGEYQRAFKAWLMFYKIGKLHNDSGAVLLGLTHLIENCTDVDESSIKEEAETISEKLFSENTEKYILARYSLALATRYLKNKNKDKCLNYLSQAKKILDGMKTSINTYILNARFWCLVSQLLSIYKEYGPAFDYPVGIDIRVVAFKAFSYANGGGRSDLIKSVTQSESTELVLAMIEVNMWAYHLYGVYRQTDFMRFFLDDLYQIVQKMFLPTRTAEMLVRLAEVDAICEKVPDCQGKVTKLKSILTTVSRRCSEITKTEKITSPYLCVPQKETDLPIPRPISPARFIDQNSKAKEMDASPVHFYLSDVKAGKVAEHTQKCKCRLCQNFLILTLTMSTLWLEAEIYGLSNNYKLAAKCFGQAWEILNKLELIKAEQSELFRLVLSSVSRKVPEELDFKLSSVQFQCARFLIRYALFEASNLKLVSDNVMRSMLKVNKLMKKFSYEEKLLEWTFAELKLFCVVLNKGEEKPAKKVTPTLNLCKTEAPTKTPLVAASSAQIGVLKNNKGEKLKKSPVHLKKAPIGKIVFESEDTSPQGNEYDEKNVALATVKKVTKERMSSIPPRKLDFDTSPDLFEAQEPKKKETRASSRRFQDETLPIGPPPAPKKITSVPVEIYNDFKDDAKVNNARPSTRAKSNRRKL